MTKSTHRADAINITMTKHPNADTLSVIPIYSFNYVGKTECWQNVKVGIWIPPDSLVPVDRPEFAEFAKEAKYDENSLPSKTGRYARIKAKNLRGIQSYGWLLPAHEGAIPGEDYAEKLGVKHYEAELIEAANKNSKGIFIGGEVAKAPEGLNFPYYDVDSFLRYHKEVFQDGETLRVYLKIHGANALFVYHNGEFHCRSRNEWKKEFASPPKITLQELIDKVKDEEKAKSIYEMKVINFKPSHNLWWKILRSHPELQEWLTNHPGYGIFAEAAGNVGGFNYNTQPGKPTYFIFDVYHNGKFLDNDEALAITSGLKWVPCLGDFTYNSNDISLFNEMATGKDLIGDHIREGIVVRTTRERWNYATGRSVLKIVSPEYLEKH